MKQLERFFERHRKILGEDFESFKSMFLSQLRDTIRTNTLKISKEELKKRLEEKGWVLKEIPWYPVAFEVLEKERPVGATLEYSLGYYYPQEKASMIPPIVLNPRPGELVLDIAAAPGSKATQICTMMENKGVLVANDVDVYRIKALASNLQRMGCMNVIVTRMDGRKFRNYPEIFDKVLVDAPCTGTGTVVWDEGPVKNWGPKLSKKFSRLQLSLLEAGFTTLKPGGYLVYSTCSLEPEEDELVINSFLERNESAKLERIRLKGIKYMEGLTEWEGKELFEDIKYTWRLYPHFNNSEGFYIALIKKVQ